METTWIKLLYCADPGLTPYNTAVWRSKFYLQILSVWVRVGSSVVSGRVRVTDSGCKSIFQIAFLMPFILLGGLLVNPV